MRLQLNDVASKKDPSPPPQGWQTIESRLLKGGYWLPVLIGLAALVGLWVALGMWVSSVGNRDSLTSASSAALSQRQAARRRAGGRAIFRAGYATGLKLRDNQNRNFH